jgi:hypothetical protein
MYSFFDVSTLTSRVLFTIFITVLDFSVNINQRQRESEEETLGSIAQGSPLLATYYFTGI